MKFIKLEILNLASLDKQGGEIIDFETGALGNSSIFSIVGPTGSGKSTILDAICLALYNRAPRYPRVRNARNQFIEIYGEPEEGEKNRLAPSDARNILTHGKKEGYSKLTFQANDGTLYRAEWWVRKRVKNYENALTLLFRLDMKNGSLSEETADWDTLPQIIGLDYEQFLRTVLIAQGSFSDFLKAKENERYELLEKIIGCQELYSSIAEHIKQQKDEAVKDYNLIAADFQAQEKNIIPDEELEKLTARIAQLEAEEKKLKAEMEIVKKAIEWYDTDEKHLKAIETYQNVYADAQNNLLGYKDKADRLALHDVTLPAVGLYKEIKIAETNIAGLEKMLNGLAEAIRQQEGELKTENEKKEKLEADLKKARKERDEKKPVINAARNTKAEIETLSSTALEKAKAREAAQNANKQADKNLEDNKKAIEKATSDLNTSKQAFEEVGKKIEEGKKAKEEEVTSATQKYNKENTRLQGCDPEKLQQEKSKAEKTEADLSAAIEILISLKEKRRQQKENLDQQKNLTLANSDIEGKLKKIDIDELTRDVEALNRTYTLASSDNWKQHRSMLKDGDPCPLCGAKDHPYHDETAIEPVISELKILLEKKNAELKEKLEKMQELQKRQAENQGKLESIAKRLEELEEEIKTVDDKWNALHNIYKEWPEDISKLTELKTEAAKSKAAATRNFKEYTELTATVEKLRKEKEEAEKKKSEYEESSRNRLHEAEKLVNDTNTILSNEKAKTQNLEEQKKEKDKALQEAEKADENIKKEIAVRKENLKEQTGGKDPDAWEKELEEALNKADNAVKEEVEKIESLSKKLNEMKGQQISSLGQIAEQKDTATKKKAELHDWLDAYNNEKQTQVEEAEIAELHDSDDDWENIREQLSGLKETLTSAATTLNNEKKAHEVHQKQKPEKEKEELMERKMQLDNFTNDEMVESKTRLQRHEDAKKEMGARFEERQEAELMKREWEEIFSAIGNDGKLLRKIAQCYTLRFLVEHANAEIRKFNSRYELQQVKNSLGLRVIDHDRADDVREITSLSGGETFIVSLGLALGLSSLSSRNIGFRNLFIDEGFGTLDPDSLATVIDALAMLQSSQGKKVGVISHTDTMSERITTQIRIIKNGNSGSSHIEIYP